jgi:phage-related minor tail protein
MTPRCDAGDAAGKIEVALEEITALVQEPDEPAANVPESDEAEVDAHQAAVYRGSIDHEDVADSDRETRAARCRRRLGRLHR